MQLINLLRLWTRVFRHPASKVPVRTVLIVPQHELLDQPHMLPVLTLAATELAKSGLLYKWISTDGTPKLVSWDASQKIFIRGTTEDFAVLIGERWIVRDTNNIEYRGPSIMVTDRLIQAVLNHPSLPIASWAEQLKRKRQTPQ